MDFLSVAEWIRDLIKHYVLLPMQHSTLSDDGNLLLCMCVCMCVFMLETKKKGWQNTGSDNVHCTVVEMIVLHFERVKVENRKQTLALTACLKICPTRDLQIL